MGGWVGWLGKGEAGGWNEVLWVLYGWVGGEIGGKGDDCFMAWHGLSAVHFREMLTVWRGWVGGLGRGEAGGWNELRSSF